MTWNYPRAQKRIERHIARAPEISGDVSSFSEHQRVVRHEVNAAISRGELPRTRAVIITGVHLYGRLLGYEDFVDAVGKVENEDLHRKMLQFLDAYYRIWGALVEDGGGFTVDFHGPRLHAVLAERGLTEREQVERAIALAGRLAAAANEIGRELGLRSGTRFGIAYGNCIAMTTGRSHERDTLFLGSPANHAAKAAAAGDGEGIFLAQSAQPFSSTLPVYGAFGIAQPLDTIVAEARGRHRFDAVDKAVSAVMRGEYRLPSISFYRPSPPLSDLKFANLTPSKTARIGGSSLFADVDGYTAFVDEAVQDGSGPIRRAVVAIHAIREELNDVLQEDFGGKRVRFIGDCIQGTMAEGKKADDAGEAVEQCLYCASGMRSSFTLIQNTVGNIGSLDLAVGIEYGPVALTRIGAAGEDSVRCAAGRSVVLAERIQQSIEGGGVCLGAAAANVAPANVSRGFIGARQIPEYDDALNLFGSLAAPAVQTIREDPSARPYCRGTDDGELARTLPKRWDKF